MFRLRSMHDSAIPHKSAYTERNSKGGDLLRDQRKHDPQLPGEPCWRNWYFTHDNYTPGQKLLPFFSSMKMNISNLRNFYDT